MNISGYLYFIIKNLNIFTFAGQASLYNNDNIMMTSYDMSVKNDFPGTQLYKNDFVQLTKFFGFAAPYQDHYCNSHNVNVNTFLQKPGLTLFKEKNPANIFLLTRNYQPTPPPLPTPQKLNGRPLGREGGIRMFSRIEKKAWFDPVGISFLCLCLYHGFLFVPLSRFFVTISSVPCHCLKTMLLVEILP